MTSKQRLLNAIQGKEIDHVPWAPLLAYYWDFLSPETQASGMVKYCKDMGADPLLRGAACLHNIHWEHCEIREETRGEKRRTVYETPVGSLLEEHVYSTAAKSWFLTTHPVKDKADFKTLMYLHEHMRMSDNLKEFQQQYTALGEEGLMIPVIGSGMKTAFQSLVEHWCGTEQITYAIYDYPELVAECLQIMEEKDRETLEIALKSPAEGFIFWEDSSTTNISPDFFWRYTMPEINAWSELLHRDNRFLIHHACGHLRDLMPLIAETQIDALESISPPPTGNIEAAEIRRALPERIALIGGIEPTFFLNGSREAVLEQARQLLANMSGSRYVLANSDSCPPGVEYEKFYEIAQLVREHEV